jgi:diguanylate cyclase (GGDEF)-like protein
MKCEEEEGFMRYTGRLAGTFIFSLIFILTSFQQPFYILLWYALLLFPAVWYFGSKYDQARFLSEKDTLTHTYTRRFIEDLFPKLSALSDRTEEKITVSVIDVDHFKQINDKYGHKQGDVILQQITDALLQNTRKSDVIARWGGDEFVVVSPSTTLAGAEVMINRLVTSIQEYSVSISIGTSVYPDDGLTLDKLIDIADKNMYKDKRQKKAEAGGSIYV